MTLKSVGLSITIPSLAADAAEVAPLAGLLQTSMGARHDVVVTQEANWTKCAKLSVFIRNLNAPREALDPLANSFRAYTSAILMMTARPPGERVNFRHSGSTPGINVDVAVEWMEEQTIKYPSQNPAATLISPDLRELFFPGPRRIAAPLSAWAKTRRALIDFAHKKLLH